MQIGNWGNGKLSEEFWNGTLEFYFKNFTLAKTGADNFLDLATLAHIWHCYWQHGRQYFQIFAICFQWKCKGNKPVFWQHISTENQIKWNLLIFSSNKSRKASPQPVAKVTVNYCWWKFLMRRLHHFFIHTSVEGSCRRSQQMLIQINPKRDFSFKEEYCNSDFQNSLWSNFQAKRSIL